MLLGMTFWKWIVRCCSFLGLYTASQPKLPTPADVPAEVSCEHATSTINRWLKACEDHPECNSHNFFGAQVRRNEVLGRHAGSSLRQPFGLVVSALGCLSCIHQKVTEFWGGSEEQKSNLAPILPKRMIHLGKRAETAHLVATPPSSTVSYAALSYCWGEDATFMTVKGTLEDFEKDIPMDKLPQTIKDAFCLTRELGLDYIWVDAICIVQKDVSEWEEESQKMGHIYSNAKIVLAATRSGNVHEGMFTKRSTAQLSIDIEAPGSSMRARRNLNHDIIVSCRTKSDYWWDKHIKGTFPLLSRGWGFQEPMLATRIVHFTPTELVWECQRSRKCECHVMESKLYPAMNNLGSALRICLKQANDDRSMRQMWREIVNSYSVRKLTQTDDKLPALSGIAGLLKDCSGDTYYAGLWRRSLPFDLLWRCDQSGQLQVSKRRSPSWSWISVDCAVKWPVCQNPNEDQPLKYIRSTTYFECGTKGIEVSNVAIELDGKDAYGRVRARRMNVKTRLRPVTIRQASGDRWSEIFGTEWEVLACDSEPAPFWPDISKEGLQLDPCRCGKDIPHIFHAMDVMKSSNTTGSWEEALVVRFIDGSEQQYERVGVVANVSPNVRPWTTAKSWFDSFETHEITLV
ncbi:HET-domain-containing protein [Hyaloscypha bicolor E]|uniref:HET-domain-containing protein n=1 Tax=Hyaloscypha bicolor E TaxID=1095630 RepID=A0A2J6SPV8_9HELO|nr:HET-domain-containing protein [Hyaloscypha bicolor E]PMD52806.1 HET-domain-containing protein [Hyaloscypha bicolor E]